ncbi:MAG: phosphate propanoyltransferase [Clostridiales bacterium]|nr:phosphate propanoyltransferase [Clostridiales bacterium]
MPLTDPKNVDLSDSANPFIVPVGISNRHLHVSQEHLEMLFGKGATLTNIKDLTQPGQYACDECVNVVGPKGMMEKMRILGPVRPQTQVELAQTDARKLGIKAPLTNSGQLAGSPGCVLVGPKGYVVLEEGVIVAKPHIHLHTSDGERLGITDKEMVDIYFKGVKSGAIFNIMARVHPEFALDVHVDTDEANSFQLGNDAKALLVKHE